MLTKGRNGRIGLTSARALATPQLMLKRWLKSGVKALMLSTLHSRGYAVKEISAPLRGYQACLEYAKSQGLAPKTVFDIGVGRGTPWLYEAFPDSKLVLFEPLRVFDEHLELLVRQHGADLHRVALSSRTGVGEIYVDTLVPTGSSLLVADSHYEELLALHPDRMERQTVQMETLDRLNHYEPPYVLKIDVEGSELEVLRGSIATLAKTDFLLLEISIMRRRTGDPGIAGVVTFLAECGFELFDIPTMEQTSAGQPVYLDAAFVREGSPLWP